MKGELYRDFFNDLGFMRILNGIDNDLVSSFTDDISSFDNILNDDLGLYEMYNPNDRPPLEMVKKVYLHNVEYWKNCINNFSRQYVITPTERVTTTENENVDFTSLDERTDGQKENVFDSSTLIEVSSNNSNNERNNNTDRTKTITQTTEKNGNDESKRAEEIRKFYLENNMYEIIKETIRRMILIDIL